MEGCKEAAEEWLGRETLLWGLEEVEDLDEQDLDLDGPASADGLFIFRDKVEYSYSSNN